MKRIYKYKLEVTDEQYIVMPAGAEILTVQTQFGQPCIWALVDIDETPCDIEYKFEIFGTGNPIDDDFEGKYIGTFQMAEGQLVYHLFLS